MYGGGNYKLTAVKEMKATKNFLNLDDGKKGCQNRETIEKCTSTNGLHDMIDKCGCIHYKMANFSNPREAPVCSQHQIHCCDEVSVSLAGCLVPCEGLFSDVWKDDSTEIDENTDGMRDIFKSYENFKNNFYQEIPYSIGILGNNLMQNKIFSELINYTHRL